jgi:hypothetical protein
MNNQWLKVPEPGQYRGEGKWVRREDAVIIDGPYTFKGISEETWFHFKDINYLPTHEGEEPPE